MDALTSLKADHKKVADILDKLEDTTERADKKRTDLFDRLNHELTVHMHVEEEILYPAIKEHKETRPMGFEAVEEHKIVKLLLGELSSLSPESEEWTAKFTVLKENVEHHVREEEQELFPKIRKIFSSEELDDLTLLIEEEKLRFTTDPFHIVQS